MDRAVVERHAKIISERQAGLAWLTEHGARMTGKSEDAEGQFKFDTWFASSCNGAEQASKLIESYARAHLPEIVQSAIACCRNDIEMSRTAIEAELATLVAPNATPR